MHELLVRPKYINYEHRRQWLSAGQTGVGMPKTNLGPKKVVLSVW